MPTNGIDEETARAAGIPTVGPKPGADLAAFDRLPPLLRSTLRDACNDIAAEPVLRRYLVGQPPAMIARIVREFDAQGAAAERAAVAKATAGTR